MATNKKYVSLEKLGLYDAKIKKFLADADAATLDAAKGYADGLAANYDAAGAAATVQGKLDEEVARAKAAEEANAAAAKQAQDEVDALELVVKNIQENAYDDTEIRGLITGLGNTKADKTQVATDIAAAVEVETNARVAAVEAVQGAVNTLSGTHATDKAALEGAIALKADQTALDAVSGVANAAVKQSDYDTKVAALEAEDARIAGLVAAETERATEVEGDFETRISAMEVFWDTTEDADGVVNKLKEIQDYIASDETGAAAMAGSIQANTDAIAAMDTAYKAADTTLQGNIDALSGVVATKAAASDLEALDGRVVTLETNSATKAEVKAVSDSLTEYKNAHAGDYTNAQIDAAIKVNTDAIAKLNDTYATDAELAAAVEAEVARANGAYAAKSLESTVSSHVDNTDKHVTTDDKAKWNAALQASDIATGATNGTIAVKGTDVAVKGLGSAAFTDASAYDVAGAAAAVDGKLTAEVERAMAAEKANADAIAAFVECSEEDINGLFA